MFITHDFTYPLRQLGLLSARKLFAHICPPMNSGLKAASPVALPPHLAAGARWVVIRCASVAGVVPLSSHFGGQGLKGVARASFSARAAWTARAETHCICCCLPSVRPPLGTTMADPVTHFAASASEFVGVQTFFGIQLCIPEVHDWMWAVSQHRMLFLRL